MPRLHEQRVTELPPNEHRGEWWVVETWRECDCPDCNVGGHWMRGAAASTREGAESLMRADQRPVRVPDPADGDDPPC